MFRRSALAMCLGLTCILAASAAPPEVKAPEKVSGEVGAFIPLRTETTGKFVKFVVLDKGLNLFPADFLKDNKSTVVTATRAGSYRVMAYSGNQDGPSEPVTITVVVGTPTPGPGPGPGPDPGPNPDPVTSFQILMVYESGATHTAAQKAVLEGKVVEEYMTAKCTGGKAGWGRRDKDTDPATDTTTLKDFWAATKPKVTTVPCVAIAVNKSVTIVPLGATPAEMVMVFDKFLAGK